MPETPGAQFSKEQVTSHLSRVLSSQTFLKADRQKRFLTYAVENTLAGNRDGLKESVIGHEVFDRPIDYDPKVDAIVRVEANRVRKKLEKYYALEGRSEPVRISMPAGGYSIEIGASPAPWPVAKSTLIWPAVAFGAILVAAGAWLFAMRVSESKPLALTPVRITSFGGVAVDPVLSHDGSSVLFSSDLDGGPNLSLWSHALFGGSPRRLTPPGADAIEPDLSPDGTKIVFHYRHPSFPGIYTIPANGGEPSQIALLGGAPRYSPDGQYILFTVHNNKRAEFGKIFVIESVGGSPDQLVPDFADAHNAIWAEDGRSILFCGTQVSGVTEKEHDWWILPFPARQGVDQAVKTGLLPEFARRYAGSATAVPPNSEIERPGEWYGGRVFFASVTGGPPSLWSAAISRDRAGAIWHLTAGTSRHASPRVRQGRVVFTGGTVDIGVWRIPISRDGTAAPPVRLTNEAPNEIYPALSPGGESLAYIADNFLDRSQPRQARLRSLASGQERILRPSANAQAGFAFSPDGSRIAFSEFGKPKVAIFVAPVAGGSPRKVCDDCGRVLDWSADGRRILYESGATVAFLSVLDIQSGDKAQSVAHPEQAVRNGKFSPDGKWVIFSAETGRDTARVFIGPAGQLASPRDWIPVSDSEGLNAGPAFSPDTRSVYYASFRPGNGAIYRRAFDTRIGRPTSQPVVVHSFDSPRRGFAGITPWHIGMSVHRTLGIILSLEERSSEIFLADLPK